MGISRQQAMDCLRSDDLIGIGIEADALRRRLHPEGTVTYQCIVEVDANAPEVAFPAGAAAIRMLCADAAAVSLASERCLDLRRSSDSLWLECSVPMEFASDPRLRQEIVQWSQCGGNSIAVRMCSASMSDFAAALELHRAAHSLGMSTVAALPFGSGEQFAERLDLLDAVRRVQQETGGFVALAPLAVPAPSGRDLDDPTAVDRLKMLAIARMYLDEIPHLQLPQAGGGLKVLQTGLRFGADDAELRLGRAGPTEQDLRRVIRDAGLMPVARDGAYSTVFLD